MRNQPVIRHCMRSARRRGATLTELGALAASLMALSALAIPGLSEARREGKETVCIANLSRIAQASMIHAAADADGRAIPVHPLFAGPPVGGDYEWGGKSGRGNPVAADLPEYSHWGTFASRGPGTRPLNRVIYRQEFPDYSDDPGPFQANWLNDAKLELDVFHCPADSGYTGGHYRSWRESGLTSYDHYGNSYAAVASWIGIPGASCRLQSNSSFLRPLSTVPAPAKTILYLENAGRWAYRRNYGIDGCGCFSPPCSFSGVVHGWHQGDFQFNAAFADGHVASLLIDGHLRPPPNFGRYPSSGSEDEYFHFHCVIIRGPDWQFDNLPAEPVPTLFPCGSVGFFNDSLE